MERDPTVDWAYASFFGTGWYKLDSERSAFVIRATPRWSLREASIDEEGNRQIGYRIRLPLTLGLNRFDVEDLPGLVDFDNFGTIGVNAGFDIDIPVSRQFSLRPNVEAGYGTVLNDSAQSWVYRADVRGRYRFRPDDLALTLNAAVGAAGHSPNTGSSQSFNYVSVAAERGHGTPWKTPAGEQINLHWQLVYTDFLGSLDLDPRPENVISVDRSWQLSAAIARADQPIRLWLLKFDRLGIGYQFSPSSDYKGVKFFLRAFYDL